MTKKKTMVAIYSRVSSDKQREEKTIKSQIASNDRYAKARSYRVVERYEDDGISGAASIERREGLNSLLASAKEGHFHRVIVWDWNRLGRQDDFELLVQLSQSGVHEIEESSTSALHDLNTFVGKLVAAVKTLTASEERKELKKKLARGKLHKLNKGIWLGSAPFGYAFDKKTGKWSYVEEEIALVKWMHERFLNDGWSLRMICDDLHRRGVEGRRGKVFSHNTLCYLFHSEAYTGRTWANRYNKKIGQRPREEWIEFKIPKLISRSTYNKILRRLAELKKTGRPSVEGRYLFQGMLKCGLCGARIRVHKNQHHLYYACHNRSEAREYTRTTPDKKRCTLPFIRADKFDEGLFRYLVQQLSDLKVLKKEIARANFSPGRLEQLEKKKQKLEREDKKIGRKITNLLSVIEDLPKQEAHERIWQRKSERAQIAEDIEEIEKQLFTAREGDDRMKEIENHIDEVGRNLWVRIFEQMIELGPAYQRKVVEALFVSLSERIEVKLSKYKKNSPLGSGVTAAWKPHLDFDLISSIAAKAKLGENLKDAFKHSFKEREESAKKVVKGKTLIEKSPRSFQPPGRQRPDSRYCQLRD